MFDGFAYRRRTIDRVWMTGLLACCVAGQLWGQELVVKTPAQAFSEYDRSLLQAADTVLASAATRDTVRHADLVAATSLRADSPSVGWRDTSLASAHSRVELLRVAIEPILRTHEVPINLAAVMLVESGGRATALSPKGARGLWQLMPETARRYGLRVDSLQDDRIDLPKSTGAAARYLHDLYAQFGDWRLALAAYNAGEGSVGSAIQRAHTHDFDALVNLRMLPLETRNYVPRVLAAQRSSDAAVTRSDSRGVASAMTVFAVSRVLGDSVNGAD